MDLKCKYCGTKDIVKSEYTYLKLKTGYSHINCHKNYLMTRKRKPMSEEEAQAEVDRLYGEVLDLKLENSEKDMFYANINSKYNISVYPSFFFVKMNQITSGKYKGMTKPITYGELNEILNIKWKSYVNIRMRKESKGDVFKDDLSKLQYDLSIMINEYDKYLKYKNKQAKIESSKESISNEMEYMKSVKVNVSKTQNKNKISVSSIINDLI